MITGEFKSQIDKIWEANIEKTMLFEPTFTDINDQGITGVFDEVQVVKIIRIIDSVNNNAELNFA